MLFGINHCFRIFKPCFLSRRKGAGKNAYEDCLYEAQRQRGKEQYQACYQAAITLNPKDSRAYKALLETFLWKDNEEQEELQGYSVCFFQKRGKIYP